MEKYDYLEEVKNDVLTWISRHDFDLKQNEDESELANTLYDKLFCEDSVTGNASGSYTCNSWEAEENICHNLDLLGEALAEFGCGLEYLADNGAEACDVTIRCYVLPTAICNALEELKEIEDEDK